MFNSEEKYVKNKDGFFCQEGNEHKIHPLYANIYDRKKKKSLLAHDKFEMNLRTNMGIDADEFAELLDNGRGFRSQDSNTNYRKRTRTMAIEE